MTIPTLNFIDIDVDALEASAKQIAEDALGRTLAAADPVFVLLKSFIAIIVQQQVLIDWAAKQNLLAFATGDYLDALGQLYGIERLQPAYATCQVDVKLSAARLSSTVINQGTRITADNQIFFALDNDVIFLQGEVTKSATATCLTVGTAGNGFAPGELNQIVDPQPFLLSIANTTTSDGGADLEDDDALRDRIHIAPESFSCAGSKGSYIARVKEVSALIDDVAVVSPQPGHVDIYLLMQGGQLPSDQMRADVADYLNQKDIRPLTDQVAVKSPAQTSYNVEASCFISNADKPQAAQIIAKATQALDDFIAWQRARLGRDLNPSKLMSLLMNAGVKRVDIAQPAFQVLDDLSVAVCADKSLTFAYEEE